jgi:hypothetical protein
MLSPGLPLMPPMMGTGTWYAINEPKNDGVNH